MLSGVRTDLLTALIAIGLYIIIKKRVKLTLMILPLVFIGGILASHYSGIAESKLKTFSGVPHGYSQWNQASSYRLDVWLTAWNMYLAHPIIGVGTQAFTHAYDEYKTPDNYFNQKTNPISHAHHPMISIAAETGTIGVIGLLTFIWLIYQWGAKSVGKNMWAIPWLQILILIFFPIQSMPLLFSFWWFPVVAMTILYYLAEIEAKQTTTKAKCS
jgi:O-antigen ligase